MELPLSRNWNLWHDTNWEDLRKVSCVQSVDQFWRLFNALPKSFPHMHNVRWFRDTIHPSREDPMHATGGKWIIQFLVGQDATVVWLNLLLDIIGSTIPKENTITGMELNSRRRGSRISVWTNSSEDQLPLGQYLRKESGLSVDFKEHHDISEQKSAYVVKSLIQLL